MTDEYVEQLVYEHELMFYPYAPIGVLHNQGRWPFPKYRYSLVACARWETRYIAEWLNYHRQLGVDHVYLYCNDDDPTELYREILPFLEGEQPFVTFYHFGFVGLQTQMYFHFLRNHSHETQWYMALDIDEFLCIKDANSLPEFMKRFPRDTDVVYFNWLLYGHNNFEKRPDGDVLSQYTRREPYVGVFTKIMVKTRSFPYCEFFNNHEAPIMHTLEGVNPKLKMRTVLNEEVTDYYNNFPDSAWNYMKADDRWIKMLSVAYIAHFTMKSKEDYDLRAKRSAVGVFVTQKSWAAMSDEARAEHGRLTNREEDYFLRDYWKKYLSYAWDYSILPPTRWPLISEGKPANQSSTNQKCSTREAAGFLVSGRLYAIAQSQTEPQHDPWWEIDLQDTYRIHEVRLFNRLDTALNLMSNFVIKSSEDNAFWIARHEKKDEMVFGGADGSPYCWVNTEGFQARWIRIELPGARRVLCLDQVQIFGERM